ncbi:hypothetical protein N7541_001087 [Penicillium brevicompactum]|uniref:NAD dependent epimerase/dehydratase n=1 Tax=Penicillium brevicompactum TaxID=5074 RepID=A0A9W9RVW3_PENBR|nr:hypothetical protein N7541_001087 [Penicillium brevicompactum]
MFSSSEEIIIPPETDIDRSKCTRVVPMRVLCLGLSRTGTNSLRTALRILGYDETYHGYEAYFENPRDSWMWLQALKAKLDGALRRDSILIITLAVTDVPAACFAEELIHAYPEAKVILTYRDIDAWYNSVMKAIIARVKNPWSHSMTFFLIFFRGPVRWSRLMALKIWDGYFRGFEVNGKQVYKEHYALVESLVPEDDLLRYKVQEGWEPLCRFLGQPVPDVLFPQGNEVAELVAVTNAYVRIEAIKAWWNFFYVVAFLGVVWAMALAGVRAVV